MEMRYRRSFDRLHYELLLRFGVSEGAEACYPIFAQMLHPHDFPAQMKLLSNVAYRLSGEQEDDDCEFDRPSSMLRGFEDAFDIRSHTARKTKTDFRGMDFASEMVLCNLFAYLSGLRLSRDAVYECYKGTVGCSRRILQDAWKKFHPVAHLWSAYTLLGHPSNRRELNILLDVAESILSWGLLYETFPGIPLLIDLTYSHLPEENQRIVVDLKRYEHPSLGLSLPPCSIEFLTTGDIQIRK